MSYEIYERLCREKGIKPGVLAKQVGVDPATISHWKSKIYVPKDTTRRKLADGLGVSLDFLDNGEQSVTDDAPVHGKGWIPVLGYVRAGIPLEAIEEIIDYEQISESLIGTGTFFALKVRGDSMSPRICENDVVILKKQEIVENGDIAVVLIDGQDATIKKVFYNKKGITLVPINPNYNPIVFTAEEVKTLPVTIVGKVIECRAKF